MEKNTETKIIAIVALIIAVFGLSIGFASFTKSFNISSTNDTTIEKGTDIFLTGLYLTAEAGNGTVTGQNTWSGLTGTINSETKTIRYTAKVHNTTDYVAYLKSVTSNSEKLTCVAVNPDDTNNEMVQDVCNNLTLSISVGNYSGTITKESDLSATDLNDGTYTVDKSNTETVTLTLTLSDSSLLPDGDFKVTIPAITFDYTSLKK